MEGLELWRQKALRLTADAPNPEGDLIVGHGPPAKTKVHGYQRWAIPSLDERLAKGGPVAQLLSHQWAVWVYTEWEHEYRRRIAEARGVAKDAVRDDLMGDIRLIRHDIVHHSGIATADNCGRCRLLKWFDSGEQIFISTEHVAEFMGHVGLTYEQP